MTEQNAISIEDLKEETELKIGNVQRKIAILNNKIKLEQDEKEKAKYHNDLEIFYDELERYQNRYANLLKEENENR